jgi:hypothetical protein
MMHTFAQKTKATQQASSAKTTMLGRAHCKQSRDVNPILHLQRTIGSQGVQRLLQTTGAPPARRPQHAEAAAGQAERRQPYVAYDFGRIPVYAGVRSAGPKVSNVTAPSASLFSDTGRVAGTLMRQPDPRSPAKQTAAANPTVPLIVHDVLRTPGRPLDPATQVDMERHLSHDFGRVRVYTDARAAASARSVNAHAYTVGQRIVFGAGRYAPETQAGRALLAHELTHTIQQRRSAPSGAAPLGISRPTDASERAARAAATIVAGGGTVRPAAAVDVPLLAREEGPHDAGVPLPGGVPEEPAAAEPEEEGVFVRSRGRRERLDPSRVTQGIWWLNGATPTFPQLYPNEATLNTGLPASGAFRYSVTAGTRILGILDGGTVSASRTARDDPTFRVRSLGASTSAGDVTIRIEHTPPGASQTATYSTQQQVRAPHRLELLDCSHAASGRYGYETTFRLKVFDNFDAPMPYINVNEDFTAGTLEAGTSSDWRAALAARRKGHTITLGDAIFHDNYRAGVVGGAPPPSFTPRPSNPQSPLGTVRAATFTHWWYVGSPTTGQGVRASEHIGVLYTDHGQYSGFLSPALYVVRPVSCPPAAGTAPGP